MLELELRYVFGDFGILFLLLVIVKRERELWNCWNIVFLGWFLK